MATQEDRWERWLEECKVARPLAHDGSYVSGISAVNLMTDTREVHAPALQERSFRQFGIGIGERATAAHIALQQQ